MNDLSSARRFNVCVPRWPGKVPAGLSVCALESVYGRERDAAIARARVVLNMHRYETRIFEIVRVSYLLANAKAVVAECDEQTEIEPELRGAVRLARYDDLVDACVALVRDDTERRELERRGFEIMSERAEEDYLRTALSATEALR